MWNNLLTQKLLALHCIQFAGSFELAWVIGSAVKEDDKVVRGPRVLIQVDQHLQHDHEDDLGDVGGGDDGDGDGDNDEYLSPVEDGRVGLHLRDWVLGIENVNYRHSAFKFTKNINECQRFPMAS